MDIHDIPYEDVKLFLKNNGKVVPDDTEKAYKIAFDIIKKGGKDYPISVIEWITAYNLLKNKAVIPRYTVSAISALQQNRINELAKLLTMKGNNVNNIINILYYLHKIDNESGFPTYIKDIDLRLMADMDNKTLNSFETNKYVRDLLSDQNFWKLRLSTKLGLKSDDKNFDYRFAVKFLDNGKSIDENYQEAMDKGLHQIVKLLLDNGVVQEIKPGYLMGEVHTTLNQLGDIKNKPYNEFIDEIFNYTNEIEEDNPITRDYFDKIVYTGKTMDILLYNYNFDADFDLPGAEEFTKLEIISNDGLSNGEILYKIAQNIPDKDEIDLIAMEIIRKNSDWILEKIEEERKRLSKNERIEFDTKYPKEFMKNLIEDPKKYLDYMEKNPNFFIPTYRDVFGGHIYWEGLTYNSICVEKVTCDAYYIDLGS